MLHKQRGTVHATQRKQQSVLECATLSLHIITKFNFAQSVLIIGLLLYKNEETKKFSVTWKFFFAVLFVILSVSVLIREEKNTNKKETLIMIINIHNIFFK
jgi:hypothetical protein